MESHALVAPFAEVLIDAKLETPKLTAVLGGAVRCMPPLFG